MKIACKLPGGLICTYTGMLEHVTFLPGVSDTVASPVPIVGQLLGIYSSLVPGGIFGPGETRDPTKCIEDGYPNGVHCYVHYPAGMTPPPSSEEHIIGSDLPIELRGGMPVSVATSTPPPPVQLGPVSSADLTGPISDTATTEKNGMSTVTNLLGAGLDWLAGGTPQQIVQALNAGQQLAQTISNPPAVTASPTTVAPVTTTTTSTQHPMNKGVYYKAVFDASGNIVGYKAVKRRRRRRKLLTDSDAAGLIQLKSIFGGMRGGTGMIDSWIMTRGR